MNSIFFNKIEDAKCIKIYLHEKIDEKVINDTLIKLGLISLEFANSKGSEKYYYFELEEERSYASSINYIITWNYIKVDFENSCICINYPKDYNYIGNYKSNILYKILSLLIKENIITEKYNYNLSDAIEGRGGTQYEMPKQSVEDIIEKIKLGKNIGGELHYSGKWIDKTKILI
ncbi:hypothetical protein [Brachyspira aalborgi]|uniref:Uncharacterized protein n=1 Tax=Brachyspira aalborgi TaxID=29522 RepID=A0A5C8CHA6_9SPIR|nr:hypothetical protein [Brachyspira aalborgi]TXJ11072.1 hypothetical protein EPJ80_10610 [Brachyspira aalborgi]